MRCGFPNKRRGRLPLPEKENHWAWSSSGNEKGRMSVVVEVASVDQAEDEGYEFTGTLHTINTDDPFPIDPHSSVEERQFTLRAVLVGCTLGAVIATSNVYLRLRVRPSNSIFDVHVANSIRPGGCLVHPPWLHLWLCHSRISSPSRRAISVAATFTPKKTTLSKPPRAPPARSDCSSPPISPPPLNSASAPPPAKTLAAFPPL